MWVAQKSDRDSDRHFIAKECYINPAEERTLAFDRPGIIKFVNPEEGDPIKSNEIVAGLKAEVAEAASAVAKIKSEDETQIEYVEAARDVAKVEFDKAKETNDKYNGTISGIELLRLELELKKKRNIILILTAKPKLLPILFTIFLMNN